MSKKLNKYKISLGCCGGRGISSNVIKAYTAGEAAKKYLDNIGEPYTEKELEEYTRNTHLYLAKGKSFDEINDVLDIPLAEGDLVAFIEKYDTYMLRISTGRISRFTDAKAYVIDANGKEFSYVADDFGIVKKIVKLDAIEHCNEVGAYIDALGQKIEEGCTAVYLGEFRVGGYNGHFIPAGILTTVDDKYIKGDLMSGRKAHKSVVIISR